MIIDFRCRPPIKEFIDYFDIPRITWHGARSGAREVPKAFVQKSLQLFFEEMDQAGVSKAVVLGRNSPEIFMGKKFNAAFISNERIAELQGGYSGRFLGFAGIDVSATIHNPVREIERSIKELGLKGIFIEPGRSLGTKPDDERIFPVYEKCLELAIPVNIMSGPYAGPDISSSDPLAMDRLATRFPELKIICGHGCYPYIQEIIGVAFKHPNVYISPDMYMFAPGARGYVEAANFPLKEQMIFGSAYPLRSLVQTVEDTRNLPFEPEVLEQYFSGNAIRLLNL